MKKISKVLLFVISIFTIFSVNAMSDKMVLVEDKNQRFFEGGSQTQFHFKMVEGNSSAYAFCLDSNMYFFGGATYDKASSITGISSNKVRNVIFKAYVDGLGTDRNVYGLSNKDFYGVAQMAVWYAAHGTGKGGLHSNTYKNWLANSAARTKAYNALIAASDPVIPKYDFKVESKGNTLTATSDKRYLESGAYKVVGSSNLTYTVTAGSGACVLYKDSCKGTQTVEANSEFKLRTAYISDMQVDATATITSSKYLKGYDFALFVPGEKKDKEQQNAAVFVPQFDSFKESIKASGEDKIVTDLKVSKTDATGQKEIAGAKLIIKDSNGKEVASWISEKGKTHVVSGLNPGEIYNLTENAAPAGYLPIHNSIYFKLSESGKVTTCNLSDSSSDKTKCEAMSTDDILRIKNETTKLSVSKTDATGQKELGGAKLVIKNSNGKEVTSWTSEEGKTHIVEGLNIGEIYNLTEDAAPAGYAPIHNSIYFKLNENGKVTTCNLTDSSSDKTKCEAMSTDDILKIKNESTKMSVSKTDVTGQKELGGAKLVIKDNNGKEVTSWISEEGKTHIVEGLVVGDIYELVETVAPVGYKKLVNSIKFVLNENGSVTTCNIEKDSNGKDVCKAMSVEDILKIKNDVIDTTKLVISKKDLSNDDEIPGAHMQLICPDGKVIEWTSTDVPYEIEGLPAGKYTLIETLPADNYNVQMIISGQRVSKYEFELKDGEETRIDVYNEIIPDVPKTGVSATMIYTIGGIALLLGVGTIAIVKRKETM